MLLGQAMRVRLRLSDNLGQTMSSCALGSPCIPAINAELYDPRLGHSTVAGAMNTIQPVGGILLNSGEFKISVRPGHRYFHEAAWRPSNEVTVAVQ